MKAPVFDMAGNELRQEDLPGDVFGVAPSRALMHQALVRQMANARQGTHATQTRSEVSRTKSKWFRQKGTGRARHGSRSANLFVGGAVAHGPAPRSYKKKMPRKMRRSALRSALSSKAADGAIRLVDEMALDGPRTRTIRDLVETVCDGASTLVLLAGPNEAVERSIRNLPHVRYLRASYLNVRDILGHECLILPLDALAAVVDNLGSEGEVTGDA